MSQGVFREIGRFNGSADAPFTPFCQNPLSERVIDPAPADAYPLRFQGRGPVLQIQNSQLSKPDGILLVEGTVDLRQLGQQNFFSRIQLSPIEKAIHWGGWRLGPMAGGKPGTTGLQMQRKTAQDRVQVGLDYEVDSQVPTDSVRREGVQMDYSLSSEQRVNLRLDRDKEFVGVEHRKQF